MIRDRRGRIVENVDLVAPAQPGKDLTLCIDRRIQFLAYRELQARAAGHRRRSGSAVVLDVATGEVLAMVNLPSFNPNARRRRQPDAHRNRAVTDVVEPGSTIKPFTVAAALENGVDHAEHDRSTPIPAASRTAATASPTTTTTACSTPPADHQELQRRRGQDGARAGEQTFHDFVRSFGYGRARTAAFPARLPGCSPRPRWSGTTKQPCPTAMACR